MPPITSQTAPTFRRQRTHLRRTLVGLVFASLLVGALPAVETTTTGYDNSARSEAPGTLLSGPDDNDSADTGRTTTVQYVGGWIWIGAEEPGSGPGADREWKVYNIEDPTNPVRMLPSDFGHSYPDDSWGSGNYGWNAHASAHTPGLVLRPGAYYGSELGGRVPGVQTWGGPFELVPTDEHPTRLAGHGRGTMAGPWGATFQWYGSNDRDFIIYHDFASGTEEVATIDHIGQFGGGDWHPMFFGDLLIYARSGGDSDGIVVYRLVYNDFDDPESASITPQFVAALHGSFRGYWPNLCSDGSGLYVLGTHTEHFQIVDITAAAEPGGDDEIESLSLYTQYDARNATYPVYQDHFAFADQFKIDISKMIAGDPDPVVLELDEDGEGVDCSQMSLPLGNLWLTGGYGTGTPTNGGMGVWVQQQAADTTRPRVAYHIPQANRENYPIYAPLSFIIPETPREGCPVNGEDFLVRKVLSGGALGDAIAGTPILDMSGVFTFTPTDPLDADSTYQVDFVADSGAGHGYRDAAGNYIEPYSFRFSTGSGVAGDPPPTIDDVIASDERPLPNEQITVTVDATVTGTAEYRFNFDGAYGSWGSSDNASHTYASEGRNRVLVQVRDDSGFVTTGSVRVTVITPPSGAQPTHSGPMAVGDDDGTRYLWVVNPDADTVSVLDADDGTKRAEVRVGADPRNIARDADGRYWVSCHDDDSLYVLEWDDGNDRVRIQRVIELAYGSAPFGVCAAPGGGTVYVTHFGSGELARYDITDPSNPDVIGGGSTPRAIAVSADGEEVYVTRFISRLHWAEVREFASTASTFEWTRTIKLDTADQRDGGNRADGVPNYLSGIAIHPDGEHALVTSKQDNTGRGEFYGLDDLTFETSVRAVISVIDLADNQEHKGGRRDFDNSADPSAVTFTPDGDYALVTLQGGNRLVGFDSFGNLGHDASTNAQLIVRRDVGLAPQGVLVDAVADRVYVQDFMDRTVTIFDAGPVIDGSRVDLPLVATVDTVAEELLTDAELRGKQIFYDAADPRMSADGYIACATCHNDGGSDGRVWDFTGRGEGLRRTTDLRGRAGVGGHGNVHWSANFDEIQDFEHDIRSAFGGEGLIVDPDFATNHPDPSTVKRGLSDDLDALAAYVSSLDVTTVPKSPHRASDGTLTAAAIDGRAVFDSMDCASCHSGDAFTDRLAGDIDAVGLADVGTVSGFSGERLGGGAGSLAGIDVPSLWGLHAAHTYLHHGQAETLDAVFAFTGGQYFEAEDAAEVWEFKDRVSKEFDGHGIWPDTIRRFWFGGGRVEVKRDREDLDGDGNLDVDEDLDEDGELDPGEDVDGDGKLDTENEDHNGNGQLDVFETGIEITGVDGGPGGKARITVRYSARFGDTDAVIRVNGSDHPISLERQTRHGTGNSYGAETKRWSLVSVEADLNSGTGNTVQVLRLPSGSENFLLDAVWVANADVLTAADAHRQVQDLSTTDRDALVAYLQQIDGRDDSGAIEDHLVAWWRMDDGNGTTATDSSPTGGDHSGTLNNGAAFIANGRLGGGVRFDGVDDEMHVGNSSDINSGGPFPERTVSAWFRVDDATLASRKQVIFEEGGGSRGLNIYVFDGRLYVGGWNDPNDESDWNGTFLSTDQIQSGTWHHVALTLRGAGHAASPALIGYLDGEQFALGAGSQLWGHGGDITIGANGSTKFHSGSGSEGSHFAGRIDEVRIYNRALRAGEIRDLHRGATGVNRDWWTGISGGDVVHLTGSGDFPDQPTGSDQLTGLQAVDWDDPTNTSGWADSYGQRLHGYIQAPESGDYVFWISSDDASELWLSPDSDPAKRIKIAEQPDWNGALTWDDVPEQNSSNNNFSFDGGASGVISLQAGERYYLEALHKEGGGGDHLAVAWRKPSDSSDPSNGDGSMIVPPSALEPAAPPWLDAPAYVPPGGGGGGEWLEEFETSAGGDLAETSGDTLWSTDDSQVTIGSPQSGVVTSGGNGGQAFLFKATSDGGGGNGTEYLEWRSEQVLISGTSTTVTVDVAQDVDGVSTTEDYEESGTWLDEVEVFYQINGGTLESFGSVLGDSESTGNVDSDGSAFTFTRGTWHTFSQTLTVSDGDNVRVVVRGRTTGGSEDYAIDNVSISGGGATPAALATIEIDPHAVNGNLWDFFVLRIENTGDLAIESIDLEIVGGGGFDVLADDPSFTVTPDPGTGNETPKVIEPAVTLTFSGDGLLADDQVVTGTEGGTENDIDGSWTGIDATVHFEDGSSYSGSLDNLGDSGDGDPDAWWIELGVPGSEG